MQWQWENIFLLLLIERFVKFDFKRDLSLTHDFICFDSASIFSNKKVICLDGDGSMLMHLGSLFTIGQNSKKNLKYILLNNNSHESVGGQQTNLANINLNKIVKELNFDDYYIIKNKKDLNLKLKFFLQSKKLSFLEVKMSSLNSNHLLGRPSKFIDIKNNFMK